jgi:antitoxin component of MazEF toxin-antitoxin module
MKKDVTLRRVGNSLFLTIPAEFVKAFRLGPGDTVSWDGDENGATIKFFRVTTSRTPAVMGEEEAASAE